MNTAAPDGSSRPSSDPDTAGLFLSYAREDLERAQKFASAFEARGWNVWWDRDLMAGHVFDAEIARRLAEARCVVVLWSATSIHKRWVRDEAEEAAAREILIPVLIDDVKIPLGFRKVQAERLIDWDGQDDHPNLLRLLAAIDARLHGSPAPVTAPTSGGARRRLPAIALAVGPTVIALVLAWSLASWTVATRFDLEATVSRLAYVVDAHEGPVQILASMPVRGMVVERFSSFEIDVARSEWADTARYDIASDTFPADAWQALTTTASLLRFTPATADTIAKIAIAAAGPASSSPAVLDAIRVAPGSTVTAHAGQPGQGLSLKLRGDAPRALLIWDSPLEVVADHALLEGVAAPGNADSRSYRLYPKSAAPVASFTGDRDELIISLRPAVQAEAALLAGSAITVASVDFTRQDGTGRRVSAIAAPSLLRFPGSSRLREQPLGPSDMLQIDELRKTVLKQLRFDPARGWLVVVLSGEAARLRVGAGGAPVQVQATALSQLQDERPLLAVLLAVVWFAATAIGVVALVRRTRS